MPENIFLESSLNILKGIGPTIIRRFKKLGVESIKDLLFYYPFRYDDFSKIISIAELRPGERATIKGRIILIANRRSRFKKMFITEAIISDKSSSIKAVWFNQPFLTKILSQGEQIYLAGEPDYYSGTFQFTNPSYEKVKVMPLHTARLVPIYPTTEKLSQKQIRWAIKLALPAIKQIKEWLPREIIKKLNLFSLAQSLAQIHFPQNHQSLERATYRLKFNELFLIQLRNFYLKKELAKQKSTVIKFKEKQTKNFVNSLPFKLTNAQRKTSWEILKDLEKNYPMNRLLEGDVGSGKTIVATIALLNASLNKYQSTIMAPTEILAHQHFETISQLLSKFPVKIALVTRTEKKINPAPFLGVFPPEADEPWAQDPEERITLSLHPRSKPQGTRERCGINKLSRAGDIKKSELIKKISNGKIDIIIGTHALLQEKIKFKNLALIIIDEQHRFGVQQRASLVTRELKRTETRTNASSPHESVSSHFLSMTATPIPRSLALTFFGDLDLSIIDEMPPGRKKIITKIVSPKDRERAYSFLREEIKRGRQIFVICPLIDPSDKLGVKAVKTEYERLKKEVFPDLSIGLLHGKLKSKEKEKIMKDFLENKTKILVSTPVIEVGIDAPNASVMMIEGAERFGLAQLYQLRGRVGRSFYQSYCFIFTESESEKTKKRLEAVIKAKNGFELAEKDLELRGPGEIYGLKQSGFLEDLKIAHLTDFKIIAIVKDIIKDLETKDPLLEKYQFLKEKIDYSLKNPHLE